MNCNTPTAEERRSPFKSPAKRTFVQQDTENIPLDSPGGPPSSPFVANPESPPRKSPSPRKIASPQKERSEAYQPRRLTEDALRENEGLTRAVHTMEEEEATTTTHHMLNDDTISNAGTQAGFAGMDDTAFSAFSAVPNADMTRFARLGQSPAKDTLGSPTKSYHEEPTPRPNGRNTPSRNRHQYEDDYSSPTPRRQKLSRDNDTTNLLVDFTGDFTSMARPSDRSPTRNGRSSPNKYHQSELSSYAASRRTPSPSKYPLPPGTPSESRHLTNLLDFDLPPAPTPRSIPSISARELESMKSAFQSQISSLKANLSGKEAEVSSLKNAMDDAERRVGEAQEQVREERGAKETLQNEKHDWEKREQEMKDVLRSVKEEIVRSDREKEHMMQRAAETEYKREEAERKLVEAESKIAGMQAGSSSTSTSSEQADAQAQSPSGKANTSSEVEAAVTKVAKELHGLYKSKHEAKVTALKKSYSDRWEKRLKDLQSKIDELSKENEDLRVGRDATMTGVDPAKLLPSAAMVSEEQKRVIEAEKSRFEEQAWRLKSVEEELATLKSELASFKDTNTDLHAQLESSRAETAELISATEELMQLSQSAMSSEPQQPPADTRSILSRSTSGSGLKAPGFGGYSGESRIGRMPVYGRERSGSGQGGRSGLLGNIERMGRGRAVD